MNPDERDPADEPIPKLPRAPLFRKLSFPAMVRIAMYLALLYAVFAMRRPCAEGVGRFVGGFDVPPDAGPVSPAERYPGYELITAEELLERYPDAPRDAGTGDAATDASGK